MEIHSTGFVFTPCLHDSRNNIIRSYNLVTSVAKHGISHKQAAFTLVEMVVVIAILVMLTTAGVSLLHGTGAQARKTGTDTLSGLIDLARTTAITSRTQVVLAVAEPGDLPGDNERCRIGIFKVETWTEPVTSPLTLKGVLLNRWQTLNSGIALIAGSVKDGSDVTPNPLDLPQVTIAYGPTNNLSVQVHAIAFNSRGGLLYPSGSTPVVFRIAEGNYRGSPRKATADLLSDQKVITENLLKIGRVTARPYRLDP